MEIGLIYSPEITSHQRTATLIRKAVRNLGITAKITERDSINGLPRVIVDGFDLTRQLLRPNNGNSVNYDSVVKALERIAW